MIKAVRSNSRVSPFVWVQAPSPRSTPSISSRLPPPFSRVGIPSEIISNRSSGAPHGFEWGRRLTTRSPSLTRTCSYESTAIRRHFNPGSTRTTIVEIPGGNFERDTANGPCVRQFDQVPSARGGQTVPKRLRDSQRRNRELTLLFGERFLPQPVLQPARSQAEPGNDHVRLDPRRGSASPNQASRPEAHPHTARPILSPQAV